MVGKRSPVGGSPRVLVRGRAKLVRLESWHYCGDQLGENAIRVSIDNVCYLVGSEMDGETARRSGS